MKLEVGMYARIKNKFGFCCIGKIYNINEYRGPMAKYCIDIQGKDFIFIPEDTIVKASHNIIDLIEVGDYVNGERVEEIWKEIVLVGQECRPISFNNIKSIVTKEQFEQMQYKVGE